MVHTALQTYPGLCCLWDVCVRGTGGGSTYSIRIHAVGLRGPHCHAHLPQAADLLSPLLAVQVQPEGLHAVLLQSQLRKVDVGLRVAEHSLFAA